MPKRCLFFNVFVNLMEGLCCIECFSSLHMNIKIITIVIIIISRLHWLDHFIYTVKSWVPCSWTKKISKNWYAQFCNKEDKEKAVLQVPHRRCWGKCRGFNRQNFQPAQMYSLGSYETNAPHLCFFNKESIDVTPLKFKNAMCLSNLFFYKATFTVQAFSRSYDLAPRLSRHPLSRQ